MEKNEMMKYYICIIKENLQKRNIDLDYHVNEKAICLAYKEFIAVIDYLNYENTIEDIMKFIKLVTNEHLSYSGLKSVFNNGCYFYVYTNIPDNDIQRWDHVFHMQKFYNGRCSYINVSNRENEILLPMRNGRISYNKIFKRIYIYNNRFGWSCSVLNTKWYRTSHNTLSTSNVSHKVKNIKMHVENLDDLSVLKIVCDYFNDTSTYYYIVMNANEYMLANSSAYENDKVLDRLLIRMNEIGCRNN